MDLAVTTRPRPHGPAALVPQAFLAVAAICFVVPLLAVLRVALQDDPAQRLSRGDLLQGWSADGLRAAVTDPDVLTAARTSLLLVVAAIAINLALLAPVAVITAVRAPRLRPVVTTLTLLPWIAPPVALVVGVVATTESSAPWYPTSAFSLVPFYALWSMPFTYRVLDAGLRQLDARTLFEAGRALGATPAVIVLRVLLPGMRASLVAAAGLTAATVLGEYAFAAMLAQPTLSAVLVDGRAADPRGAMLLVLLVVLLAVLSLATLVLGGGPRRRQVPSGAGATERPRR